MRYIYDSNGFYTFNPVDTNEVLPNSTSVNPLILFKPKIVDRNNPDSPWMVGATDAEKIYQLKETEDAKIIALIEHSSEISTWIKDRIPVSQYTLNERRRILNQYKNSVLAIYPDYVFPDYSNIPVIEYTWRYVAPSNATSVTLPVEIDKPLRHVTINEQHIENPPYNTTTRVLQVNINAGERLVVVY